MIIGISGKKHSGKNTIGLIIQWLITQKYIIDTPKTHLRLQPFNEWSTHLSKYLQDVESGWQIRAYADAVKDCASIMTGIARTMWDSADFKEAYYLNNPKLKNRDILTKIGDVGREINPEMWINTLFLDYKADMMAIYPDWIICDVRYPNEADAIINNGGFIIRVTRDEENVNTFNSHASELSMDLYNQVVNVYNNSTIDDLISKIKLILTEYNIL
jgi:hypothetical protein